MLAYFLQGLPLGLSAAGQPGPFQAFLLGQSIRRGWKRTLPAAFAPLISDTPIVIVTALILSQMPAGIILSIRLAGGLFLLYLAYVTFRDSRTDTQNEAEENSGSTQPISIFQAATINILSPGAWLFWSTITGPLLVTGWREAASHGVAFLVGFYGAMIAATLVLIFIFSMTRSTGPQFQHILAVVSSLLLGAFGIWQIILGLSVLL